MNRCEGKGGGVEVEDRSLPVMIVDLALAIACGTAELPPFAALVRVRLADPGAEHPRQLDAVRPEIDVVARVRAKLVPRTVLVAHGARFTGNVRVAQPTFVIPAVTENFSLISDSGVIGVLW